MKEFTIEVKCLLIFAIILIAFLSICYFIDNNEEKKLGQKEYEIEIIDKYEKKTLGCVRYHIVYTSTCINRTDNITYRLDSKADHFTYTCYNIGDKYKSKHSFQRFLESDFVFYTTILLFRIVQVSLIVLAFYFMQGGRLW